MEALLVPGLVGSSSFVFHLTLSGPSGPAVRAALLTLHPALNALELPEFF
jgi:hypothetical protein